METVIKPMTKEYLKNYPKNRELYRVVNLISNGVIDKASGRTYAHTDSTQHLLFIQRTMLCLYMHPQPLWDYLINLFLFYSE